ncbi:MAG: hypothetical protein HWN51_07040 [Desulfobacterales bacterium]|nr:hypothetical protein [Desulfobacterales bacterium]
MGYFLLFVVLGLIFLDRLRRMHINTIVRKYQFNLFALRDELREATMHGEVDPKNWVFLYLDSSIAKTIRYLGEINLWRLFFIAMTYRRDRKFLVAREHLQHELKKPSNKFLADIHEKYIYALGCFFINRHPTLKISLLNLFAAIETAQYLKRKWDRLMELLTEVPETSTLEEYVPALDAVPVHQ